MKATSKKQAERASFGQLWGWPIVLGLFTASGLLTALVSDSWGDAWSWVGLGLPTLVMSWYGLRRSSKEKTP